MKLFFVPLLLASSSFPLIALAGPIERIERRAISQDLLNTFALYEQYAAAAYCPGNNNASCTPGTKITCSAGNCPLVQTASTSAVIEFYNQLATDVTGYVATDSTNQLIVVAFRGSATLKNFITDVEFPLTSIDICSGCNGETGFWTSWTEARMEVLNAVKQAAAANPSYKIVSTGHSLGGAIAAFAAAELRNSGYTVDMCTFGQPRVGDQATSQYITNQAPTQGQNYRLTHTNDPVPRLPLQAMGYEHISPEYYISSAIGATVGTDDITEYQGLTETQGNAAWLITDILAHAWYFNSIAACYPLGTIAL